jgi:hypothetical protein
MQEFSLYGYFLNDRLVGFRSSLNATDRLIAHYVGFESGVNAEHKLYQRMLYDYVAEGIEKKLPAIHLGRTALEIKSTVGAEREDYFLLFHSDNWFLTARSATITYRDLPPPNMRHVRRLEMNDYSLNELLTNSPAAL